MGERKSGLTASSVARAKPKDKAYKLSDHDGLYLLVKPTGARYWRMNYRFHNLQRTVTFGRYPELLLADARQRLLNARRLLADGIDPIDHAKLNKIQESISFANTFKTVSDEWLEKVQLEEKAPASIKKYQWQLGLVMPAIGNRPIAKLTAHEVLLALKKIERTRKFYTATSVRATCSQVFRYAIATARAERDVCADLRGALVTPKVVHRAAITTPKEAGALLRSIEDYEGDHQTRVAMRLLPHVFVRPGELRHAEWKEFDFERKVWIIPEHKAKMRRPHAIPLSRQALAIIGDIAHDPTYSIYLFPSLRSATRPMSDNTINAALRRMGYGKHEMTAHGFRAMAATLLNEMGIWNADAIERQLAHVEANAVRRAYTRGQYWDERVRMMQHWSDYLDSLRDGAKVLRPNFGSTALG
ncbi:MULTISPECIES: integrase arm-type DNA-binding domain-containing protein [unclassified Novosphingobium]|uniref:tyrosine-type recombinase/integrase n=1 Tax=unclassified Novosphingobium TaxID=2644732 RepID=UPI00146E769D|nr:MULTISPECIES: integrase arm-type DNA-binding domain-containing protein [unclassified Novosphingobium]NMN05894.1 integrase [Novosphingobium sp. SG919]NMN87746.1 integrase [Novosphingobium sp. SG916]